MRKQQSRPWKTRSIGQVWASLRPVAASSRRNQRRARNDAPACEALESRLVLTNGVGASLLGSLSYVGVVTSPIVSSPVLVPLPPIFPFATAAQNSGWKQLQADWNTLQTELQTLAAKSGVTISELENLTNDSQAIAGSSATSIPPATPVEPVLGWPGFQFRLKTLNPVISELATAVAGGTSTSQAQTDFTALFAGSGVSTSTITTTFSDLVQTIGDSHVTTTDLSTVAADEAAIQSDLSKLVKVFVPAGAPWLDQQGAVPADLAVSPPATAMSVAPAGVTQLAGFLPSIIISPFGSSSLLGSLTYTGVVTSPLLAGNPPTSTATTPVSQLQVDVQKLRAELVTLAEKSSLTVTDLQALATDGQAINQASFHFDLQTLLPVISEMATAVAGGTSTTQAQTDFTALFSESSVSTTTITATFNDLVTAILDSHVMTSDLTTVASDQAAIRADLKKLSPILPITPIVPVIPIVPIIPVTPIIPGGGSTGSAGGTTATGHHHKLVHGKKPAAHTVKKAVSHAVHKSVHLAAKAVHSAALGREKGL